MNLQKLLFIFYAIVSSSLRFRLADTMSAYYYTVQEGKDVIYVTHELNDAVKRGVEWFFAADENPFQWYGGSRIVRFESGKMYNAPPRYGEELVSFDFPHIQQILFLYKGVDSPDNQILDALVQLIAVEESSRPQAQKIAQLDQQIDKLKAESTQLRESVNQSLVTTLIDASQAADRFIDKEYERIKELEVIEKRQQHDLEKSGEAIFGMHKELQIELVMQDDVIFEKCVVCKAQPPAIYGVTLVGYDTEGAEDADDDEEYDQNASRTMGYVCSSCLGDKFCDIVQGKVQLDPVQCLL